MAHRDLTDEQWARLQPLLPPQQPTTGKPSLDHRRIIDGILWILRTGAPWDDLPRRYGKRGAVSSQSYRWRQQGILDRVLADLQAQGDAAGAPDWTSHLVDGTVIRARQHAAGAKGGDPETAALGRSQGGCSTKLNVRAEGGGRAIAFVLQPGQRHERVPGDQADSNRRIRRWLRRLGVRATIPRQRDERRRGPFDTALYRLRARVEHLISRLKQFRRIATRDEQRAEHDLGMVTIGAILLWL